MNNRATGAYPPSTLVLYASRWKNALLLVASSVILAIGIWIIQLSQAVTIPDLVALLQMLGVGLTALFALAVLVYLVMLLRRSPLLIVSDEGLDDRSAPFCGGWIGWEEIAEIRYTRPLGQPSIRIFLVDPKAYLSRQRGLKRWFLSVNRWLVGTPVHITNQLMQMPLHQLVVVMERTRWQWAKSR